MADNTNTQSTSTTTEPTTFFSRRGVMKGAAGVVGASALAGLGLWYGTQPALAATQYEAAEGGDVTVTTNAGEVIDVSIAPVVTLNWTDFGGGVESFSLAVSADVNGDTNTPLDVSLASDSGSFSSSGVASIEGDGPGNYDGSTTVTFPETSVMGDTLSSSSFPTSVAQGTSESATVNLSLAASGVTSIGQGNVSAEAATLTFDVIIENPDGTVTATIDSSNATATGADSADETTTTAN
jgi:hypothetical protein